MGEILSGGAPPIFLPKDALEMLGVPHLIGVKFFGVESRRRSPFQQFAPYAAHILRLTFFTLVLQLAIFRPRKAAGWILPTSITPPFCRRSFRRHPQERGDHHHPLRRRRFPDEEGITEIMGAQGAKRFRRCSRRARSSVPESRWRSRKSPRSSPPTGLRSLRAPSSRLTADGPPKSPEPLWRS